MSATPSDPGWRIELFAAEPAWEFVAFDPGAPPAVLPGAPGAIVLDGDGRAALLHFAPGRWLALTLAPDATALASIGAAVDVTGKWQRLVLSGPRAARLLASTVDLAAVLRSRACAALELFDCPSILSALPGKDGMPAGYEVWVQASYLGQFLDAATRTPLDAGRDL